MDSLFVFPAVLELALLVVMFGLAAFAFVDATTQRADAYVAGDKLTKNAWMVILGLCLAVQVLFLGRGPLSIFHLVAMVAVIVYLVDVRPTLRSLTGRR